MFTIDDMQSEITLRYSNSKDESIEFNIESIINRRLREGISPTKVYILLNKYLEYKGKEFRDSLYEELVTSKNTILKQILNKDIEPLPISIVHNVLNLFDFNDVKNFLITNRLVNNLSDLPDHYDSIIEVNERGTREQTYLKNDYIDLITIITILKSVTGPVGAFATLKSGILKNNPYKEFILFNFFKTHKFYKNPAFVKIYESLNKLVERLVKDTESTAIRVIENGIPLSAKTTHITAVVVIQKLLLNNEIDDNNLRNTITRFYSFASDRLKLKDVGNNKIKIKYTATSDTDAMDNMSIFESVRAIGDINYSYIVEFRNSTKDPYLLAKQLNLDISDARIKKTVKNFHQLKDYLPLHESILISSWIFESIIDPRAFEHLLIDQIINLLAISFLYLKENGFDNLAMVISSFNLESDNFKVNLSMRSKLTQENKNILNKEVYPYLTNTTVNGTDTTVSMVDTTISIMSKRLVSYVLVTVLNDEMLNIYNNGDRRKEVFILEDIKNQLARLMILLNR